MVALDDSGPFKGTYAAQARRRRNSGALGQFGMPERIKVIDAPNDPSGPSSPGWPIFLLASIVGVFAVMALASIAIYKFAGFEARAVEREA